MRNLTKGSQPRRVGNHRFRETISRSCSPLVARPRTDIASFHRLHLISPDSMSPFESVMETSLIPETIICILKRKINRYVLLKLPQILVTWTGFQEEGHCRAKRT